MYVAQEIITHDNYQKNPSINNTWYRFDLAIKYSWDKLKNFDNNSGIPIIFMSGLDNFRNFDNNFEQEIINKHKQAAEILRKNNFNYLVLACDNDGIIQKYLSPRYNNTNLESRNNFLINLFNNLNNIIKTKIILCAEELAPGGIDLHDSLDWAQKLKTSGLQALIITQGTQDFPVLYDRKITNTKQESNLNLYSREPSLASASYFTNIKNLKTYSLSYFDNLQEAQKIAEIIGLHGIIIKDKNFKRI